MIVRKINSSWMRKCLSTINQKWSRIKLRAFNVLRIFFLPTLYLIKCTYSLIPLALNELISRVFSFIKVFSFIFKENFA